MAITKTKEILSDNVAAIRLDGVGPTPVYFRVRKTRSEIIQRRGSFDTVLGAQAYEVTSSGVEVTNGHVSPEAMSTLHGSTSDVNEALGRLSITAQSSFISTYISATTLSQIPNNLEL